jgi:hypothetical protein
MLRRCTYWISANQYLSVSRLANTWSSNLSAFPGRVPEDQGANSENKKEF